MWNKVCNELRRVSKWASSHWRPHSFETLGDCCSILKATAFVQKHKQQWTCYESHQSHSTVNKEIKIVCSITKGADKKKMGQINQVSIKSKADIDCERNKSGNVCDSLQLVQVLPLWITHIFVRGNWQHRLERKMILGSRASRKSMITCWVVGATIISDKALIFGFWPHLCFNETLHQSSHKITKTWVS